MDRVDNEHIESRISVKVVHFPTTDILVPNYRDDMDEYVNYFKDGLPGNFVEVRPEIYFDSKSEPTLVAKQRTMTAEYVAKKRHEGKIKFMTDASMNAANSLTNEFSLAEDIQQVVDSDAAQEFTKQLGFEGLKYVRPIIGIIDKTNGNKFMIYPYVPGKPWYKDPPRMIIENREPVQELINLFEEKGINPEDLIPRQMRVGTDNWMYLLDTDQYHKK